MVDMVPLEAGIDTIAFLAAWIGVVTFLAFVVVWAAANLRRAA